ncbi:MAG: isoleucine--tRNA ligase [Clostridia bacterium]|nr:isoleucine--tRNA ligase [Clostridia bacterium]
MYKEVSNSLDFVAREREMSKFWQKNKIFEKSIENRAEGENFTFYDGPPTANGKPHIGHILTRAIKDIVPRYKTMKGSHVLRKAGWDTHGLPVELEVEKLLKLDGKQDVERYGIEPFNEKCKESVWKYTTEWKEMSDAVAYWCDMDNPYVTYHNSYIESVWWAIKNIADQGLLYKGHKIVPYCPRCGTALSSHEVAQGYKDVKETSVFVKFRIENCENRYFLAWTTTPWTLPSNVALAVNAAETYVEVQIGDESVIMAEALVEKVISEEHSVIASFKGSDLLGMRYVPLFDFATPEKPAYYVVAGDFVTLTDGAGIVHIAPAFGEDDARVGRENDLPFVQLVDGRGRFTPEVTPWAGTFCKDGDKAIIADLKERGLLYKAVAFEHSYPFCWRCDTPLLYYALDTWFIRMTAVKDRLIKNNNSINWIPESIRDGRMGNFLENVVDWGLSRSRYWGTPLPVWVCSCGHFHVVGSIEELKARGKDVPDDIELHKPYVDRITLTCDKCGGEMHRTPEVIDCWFDSGSMPFAQWHYPFENKELFEQNYPADFISEAVDQTRGWFYTLLAISTLLFDKAPFKNCIVLGHVCDKDGYKMSKHRGNVVDPWTILNKQGADAVRWYFYSASAPWLPSRFYEDAVNESQRKFMGTLWNTYYFFTLYANIDGFAPNGRTVDDCKLTVMDKWILSRLNTLIRTVDSGLAEYKITESARAVAAFTDELSNWYVRRGRERFWVSGESEDKDAAFMTLHTVLVTLSKVIAPFVPFLADEIYQNLVRSTDDSAPLSVHLCDFPVCDESKIDADLEKNMDLTLRVVVLGRACRAASAIKNRQPLSVLYVKNGNDEVLPDDFAELAADELNVKSVSFTADADRFVSYLFKPQLKTCGKKFGKLVPQIKEALLAADGSTLMQELKAEGKISLALADTTVEMLEEDLLVETKKAEGFIAESDKELTVALDISLTDALIEEGYVREIVNKLQTMRKDAGFAVTDKIHVTYAVSDKLVKTLAENADDIASDVLALSITAAEPEGFVKEWNINGETATFGVRKDNE